MAAHPNPNSNNGNGKMPPKAAKTKGYTPSKTAGNPNQNK